MRIAYFDSFAGLCSDMLLGSLLDAGVCMDALQPILAKLPLADYALCARTVARKELPGVCPNISTNDHRTNDNANGHSLGSFPNSEKLSYIGNNDHHNLKVHNGHNGEKSHHQLTSAQIIKESDLPDLIKQTSLAVFSRLAHAEATIFPQRATLTSRRANVDEVITVVAMLAGLSLLGINRVECSPLHIGSGLAHTPEGIRPSLSPVTAEILRAASVPVYGSTIGGELITPLGAAIITTIASAFGPIPSMKICTVGYGAGKADLREAPNLVRLFIGETTGSPRQIPVVPQTLAKAAINHSENGLHGSVAGAPNTLANPAEVDTASKVMPFLSDQDEWITLTIKGHQQSGRQRLAS